MSTTTSAITAPTVTLTTVPESWFLALAFMSPPSLGFGDTIASYPSVCTIANHYTARLNPEGGFSETTAHRPVRPFTGARRVLI